MTNTSGSAWQVSVSDIADGSTVTYYFAYQVGGVAHQTDFFTLEYVSQSGINPIPEAISRGMWVWSTPAVVGPNGQAASLITSAKQAQVTDLYMYLAPTQYDSMTSELRAFISQAGQAGLRVWGLDGDRGYLDDGGGPAPFYQGIKNLLAYNAAVNPGERFFGFQSDIEPNDLGDYTTFHDGITDSSLSTAPGSGVWQSTQAQDREMLMRSWLTIHQTAQSMLHQTGLRFGAAMPSWTVNYYGEEIHVTFPADAARQGVTKVMMQFLDDYVIMTYNTNPQNAANRALLQAQLASTLPANARPRVYASVETNTGVGVNVSYGDTPGKQHKSVVLNDMQTITNTLQSNAAFHGMSIESWEGWSALPN